MTPGRRIGVVDRRPLAEFKAKAQGQLILLDFSISVDVAVIQQQFPEAVQLRATDAGLKNGTKNGRLGNKTEETNQGHPSVYLDQLHHVFDKSVYFRSLQFSGFTLKTCTEIKYKDLKVLCSYIRIGWNKGEGKPLDSHCFAKWHEIGP